LAEFEGYLALSMLPEWLMPADVLTRREEIVSLLERKREQAGSRWEGTDSVAYRK
jgi:hypothetical protein